MIIVAPIVVLITTFSTKRAKWQEMSFVLHVIQQTTGA